MNKKCIQITGVLALVAGALVLSSCGRPSVPTVTYSDPYDSPQQLMEGIYAADQEVETPASHYRIRATIVPHHLTATRSIAAGIKMLEHQRFKKILLLSPDHFAQCPTLLCTTNGIYKTQLGIVKASASAVDTLAASSLVTVQPDLFQKEHGIYAVLPYIAHYFPGVPVTPVVLSQKPWQASQEALLQTIEAQLDEDTILIVSSDFSHYLSLGKANEMDEKTTKTLFAKDLTGIANLKNPDQSDCPNCLWTLGAIAAREGFYNPSVIFHTNAAVILNDTNVKETTSHFAMVWYQNSSLSGDDLAVAGDVTMTRRKTTPQLSAPMMKFWSGSGLRFVNLEGPVLQTCARDRTMFDFCNAETLWRGMLGLATHWGVLNNHSLDQYMQGLEDTKRLILAAGETPVADTFVESGSYRLIALTALMNPVLHAPYLDKKAQYDSVLSQLQRKTPGVMTVVLVHEGVEYRSLTSETENAYLRSFIDAGADVVVASHTHVVSDMTIYKGKPIFRGVGNFIFDQHDTIPTSTAKAVRLRMTEEGVEFETAIERT